MFYVANGNAYVRADDGTVYPVEVSVKEKVTERREIESFKLTKKEESVELPDSATSATIDEIIGKFGLTADKSLTFDQAKHDEALSESNGPKSEARVSIKTGGSFLGVNYADLGTFNIKGLSITGTAKQATAKNWNGPGGHGGETDKTGYFIGLHFDNAKSIKTANHPEGKTLDDDGDLLLLLGEESPTLAYIDVVDNKDVTDHYTVSITTAGPVSLEPTVSPAPKRRGRPPKVKSE